MDLIKLNSKGSFVRQLQVMLNLAGYQLHEDGHFGKNVQNAVMDFQSRNELTPDGKVGVSFHAKSLGYSDVVQFVEANYRSEGEQLDAFVRFIEVNKLDGFLRKKDWAGFAYRYNGAQYKLNKYDEKLAKAYSNAIGASRDIDFTAEKFKINHIGRPFGIDKEWF